MRSRRRARYGRLEAIPDDWRVWSAGVAGAERLAGVLRRERERALLFRNLATLRHDIALFDDVETLRWTEPGGKPGPHA